MLVAELPGFERVERTVPIVHEAVVLNLTMALAAIQQQVLVVAGSDAVISEAHAGAPATVTREVIEAAMLPHNTFQDVLPLLPNVVRGPDGLISVAGARAPQGQLLVNGLSQNDPVLGEPDIMLPLDPIGSVQVLSNGYPTEFGRAIGGVTLVQMRPGTEITLSELDAHCRAHVAGYKVPRHLKIVPEIQRQPSGKPDYRWAREMALLA